MAEEINIPLMMRQARKAVAQENYAEAESLYALVLQDPEMAGLIDIQTRFAFCVEKKGDISKAIGLYQKIVCHYQDSGERGAAKALELKITILSQMEKTEPEAAHATTSLDDALKAGDNQLIVSEDDISPLDEMDFLSLGTQDLTHFDEDEVTQQLPIMEGTVEASTPAKQETCVDITLTAIDDEIVGPLPDKRVIKEVEMVTEAKKKSVPKEIAAPLDALRNLIRKGIHKNIVQKGDGKDVKLSFTDIGEHELELLEEQDANLDAERPLIENSIKKTADQLFGGDGMHKQEEK